MKILLIEDDREAASYLIQALDEAGHVTHHASDGETGYAMASGMDYDVLIVDRMLPQMDGLSLVKAARATGMKAPVLFLTTMGGVDDRVAGLDQAAKAGARGNSGCNAEDLPKTRSSIWHVLPEQIFQTRNASKSH